MGTSVKKKTYAHHCIYISAGIKPITDQISQTCVPRMFPTVSSVDFLAPSKHPHTLLSSIWHLQYLPAASLPIQILCLSKAQGGINKRSALEVMEEKQRQVVQDCAHDDVSVGTVDKLMVCIREPAAVEAMAELCEERGQLLDYAQRGGSLCGHFGREGWESGAKLELFSSSTFPCGSTTHTNLQNKGITHSVHLLSHLSISLSFSLCLFSLDYENTAYMRLIVSVSFPLTFTK